MIWAFRAMEDHYRQLNESFKKTASKIRLNVFVAGPYLDPSWLISPEDLPACVATRNRYGAINFLKSKDVRIFMGEHKQLAHAIPDDLKTKFSFTTAEYKQVIDSHLIIIFPSSPGSFCELGAWHDDSGLASKMLIIIDKKYEKDENYINTGVVKQAKNMKARVEYIDYSDEPGVIEVISDELARVTTNAMVQNVKANS